MMEGMNVTSRACMYSGKLAVLGTTIWYKKKESNNLPTNIKGGVLY